MAHRIYPALYLLFALLVFSCQSPNNSGQELKSFLTEWSAALSARDESIQRFYEPSYSFPKAAFNDAAELSYALDLDHIATLSTEDNGNRLISIPYRLTYPDHSTEIGAIELTIVKTEGGYLISEMSQQLARSLMEYTRRQTRLERPQGNNSDSLMKILGPRVHALRQHYDSVVFYTEVDNQLLFYVVKGDWVFPYDYDAARQQDGGNYKIGVVTAENKVIIPVSYSKIYNPDGSFDGMIEVENDGKRGLFRTTGEMFLPAEFDGIYPTKVAGAFAQLKKGESYGWVTPDGKVSFDVSSHENKTLFQSPIESEAILQWRFEFPGDIKILIDPLPEAGPAYGVIVYPSYIRDLGITPIGNGFVFLKDSEYEMGVTDTNVSIERVDSFSDKFFGLVSFFMESGVDARDFHSAANDLVVVDKNMKRFGHQGKIAEETGAQDPCGESEATYRVLEPGLYESEDGAGAYSYYRITAEGSIEKLETNRKYNFTKFAKIDEHYFNRCQFEHLEYRDDMTANIVLMNGYSTEELDIMRNEIFAEYGFIFKSEKWKKYFESKSWYEPRYENVDRFLTPIDKDNIKFILEYQRTHKDLQIQRDSIMFGWAG